MDIYVPVLQNGMVSYSLMEVVFTDQSGLYRELRQKIPPMRLRGANEE